MKTTILAALMVLPFLSHAQQTTDATLFPDNGIYQTAADFTHRVVTDGFNNNQPGYRLHDDLFKSAVKIDQPRAQEQEIATANLWGERVKDVDYRFVDGERYRVDHADRVFVYSKPSTINQLSRPLYYFSRQADSPVYVITSENLANVYYDQPDKKALFDQIDVLSDNPVQQAIMLTHLFYPARTTQSTASAE